MFRSLNKVFDFKKTAQKLCCDKAEYGTISFDISMDERYTQREKKVVALKMQQIFDYLRELSNQTLEEREENDNKVLQIDNILGEINDDYFEFCKRWKNIFGTDFTPDDNIIKTYFELKNEPKNYYEFYDSFINERKLTTFCGIHGGCYSNF